LLHKVNPDGQPVALPTLTWSLERLLNLDTLIGQQWPEKPTDEEIAELRYFVMTLRHTALADGVWSYKSSRWANPPGGHDPLTPDSTCRV